MPKQRKLTKKDIIKALPRKVVKAVTLPLDVVLGNPMSVIGLVALMTAYAKSHKSSREFKTIYNNLIEHKFIHALLVMSAVNAIIRLILKRLLTQGSISKRDYDGWVKILTRILRTLVADATLMHFLYNIESLDKFFIIYMRNLKAAKQMPKAVRDFITGLNPRKPDLTAVLKAARRHNIKAPWLSKMSTLLNKLKTFK